MAFTSPTHTVRAYQALLELEQEGGIEARHHRYQTNQKTLVAGMRSLGFEPLLSDDLHSPIITSSTLQRTVITSSKHFTRA